MDNRSTFRRRPTVPCLSHQPRRLLLSTPFHRPYIHSQPSSRCNRTVNSLMAFLKIRIRDTSNRHSIHRCTNRSSLRRRQRSLCTRSLQVGWTR